MPWGARAEATERATVEAQLAECRARERQLREQLANSASAGAALKRQLRESDTRHRVLSDAARAEAAAARHQLDSERKYGAVGALVGVGAAAAAILFVRHRSIQRVASLASELASVRRAAQADVARAERWGAQPLATSLIPVCDNVEALVASTADADDALAEGARLTADSLFAALASQHVTRLAPAEGAKFDPAHHEALYTVPHAADAGAPPPSTVAALVRPGWLLHERVLRAAQVGVVDKAEAVPEVSDSEQPGQGATDEPPAPSQASDDSPPGEPAK